MWLYVNSFRLCVRVGTYLVETMSWNVILCLLLRYISVSSI